MKYWFVCVIAALLVSGAQAGEKGAGDKKKGGNAFATLDADKDGMISKLEFVAAEQKKAEKTGKDFNAKRTDAMFAKRDLDGNGCLSKDEMATVGKKKNKPAPQEDEDMGDE